MTTTSFETLHRIATKDMDKYAMLSLRLSEEYNVPDDVVFELGQAAAEAYATHKAMLDSMEPKKSLLDRIRNK